MFRFSSNKPNSSLMITIYSISSWLKLTTVYRSLRIAMGFYAISKIESYEMKWLLFYCYIDEMCGWQFDNNANVHLILVQVHTIYRFKPKWHLTPKLTYFKWLEKSAQKNVPKISVPLDLIWIKTRLSVCVSFNCSIFVCFIQTRLMEAKLNST